MSPVWFARVNPLSLPRTLARTLPLLLSVLAMAILGGISGCGGGETKAVADASRVRLEGVDPDQRTVFACKMKTIPETFPLESGERELLRGPNAILIESTAGAYDRLGKTPGVGSVLVLGTPVQLQKMDPWLQAQVVNAWSKNEAVAIPCLAQFVKGTTGIREKLEALGIQPGTVAGLVVTLEAQAPALIELIQVPELQTVTQPKNLVPLKRNTEG